MKILAVALPLSVGLGGEGEFRSKRPFFAHVTMSKFSGEFGLIWWISRSLYVSCRGGDGRDGDVAPSPFRFFSPLLDWQRRPRLFINYCDDLLCCWIYGDLQNPI
jgi:hypothetical protein